MLRSIFLECMYLVRRWAFIPEAAFPISSWPKFFRGAVTTFLQNFNPVNLGGDSLTHVRTKQGSDDLLTVCRVVTKWKVYTNLSSTHAIKYVEENFKMCKQLSLSAWLPCGLSLCLGACPALGWRLRRCVVVSAALLLWFLWWVHALPCFRHRSLLVCRANF